MLHKRVYGIAAIAILLLAPVIAQDEGPTFIPDTTFKATSLTGWHALGQADWRVQNGEVVGTVKPGGKGGWLVLDRSYQDIELYTSFRCSGGCQTGVMFRLQKTAEGQQGMLVSLTEGDLALYRVTLSADGQELKREPLRPAGGGDARGGAADAVANVDGIRIDPNTPLPMAPPKPGLRPGDWNQVELFLDATGIQAWLNDVNLRELGGVPAEEAGRYGPLALYVGGAGEVRFKDIAYKDLGFRYAPAEQVSSRFRMQRLNEFYYAWSAAAADFNRDGVLDVVAGPYIYYGPDYSKSIVDPRFQTTQ